mmetsp:Transcript_6721/g.12703  ORF Transcript_6721/g.12703 Transcript_6721/m.12703 type:complete len:237 (-) Transcript_6721:2102-2812(-)
MFAELSALLKQVVSSNKELAAEVASLRQQQQQQQQQQQNQLRTISSLNAKVDLLTQAVTNMPLNNNSSSSSSSSQKKSRKQIEKELAKHVAAQQFNQAFVLVLGEDDVGGVLKLCSQLQATTVFSPTLPASAQLEPPVCLSLVQQLAWEISSDDSSDTFLDLVQLRLTWLQESLMALPTQDPVIADHVGKICDEVVSNLDKLEGVVTKVAEQAKLGPISSAIRLSKHLARVAMRSS